ncbi:MAG: type II 3-dehydroquinate dehydratase [Bacilli bacterium]|nr:type II 3-dehydroquinate dehydratase [Bacilli bacterium]
MKKLLIVNGPNINMLGIREPNVYGKSTYQDLVNLVTDFANSNNVDLEVYQSNHEGALVDKIQQAYFDKVEGIVINPGAYTHTSIAILDALKAVNIPFVEVHISDVSKREDFRQISYIRPYAVKSIIGLGLDGYVEAMKELLK